MLLPLLKRRDLLQKSKPVIYGIYVHVSSVKGCNCYFLPLCSRLQ
jgi:hypothetical protein